jgi:hypothetical protein
MEQVSAVEWLENEIGLNNMGDFLKDKIQQAKEMEKEQMLEVSKAGCFGTFEFEDYYNENYKSE